MLETCHVCGNGIITEADIFVFQHTPAGDLYAHADCYTKQNNYVNDAMRTDTPITQELIARLTDPDFIRLLHAGMGLCTESGEFMDMLKRHLFYGKPLDFPNAKEEIGDIFWYSALAVDVIRTTIAEVMTANIGKLRLRYPEKFCEVKAINRNLTAERELLETFASNDIKVKFVEGEMLSGDSFENDYEKAIERQTVIKNIIIQEMCKEDVSVPVIGASKRGQDWIDFSRQVLMHIENYTVPQYGDKGSDQASEWDIAMLIEQTKKYANRYGKNSRPGQEMLDFMKGAHYLQIAATLFKNGER